MTRRFRDAAQRYLDWCGNVALPFWADRGVDAEGGFYERMTASGAPDADAPRRVRVQMRQIYVFAHAHALGWHPRAGAVAAAGARFADARVYAPRGAPEAGCGYILDGRGDMTDPTRDLYTQAFALLALAWRRRALGDPGALRDADAIVQFMDREMASPAGGWVEALPRASGPRRQNPHMHLFEAFLALYEAAGRAQDLARARDMTALFETRLFDQTTGCLLEYFNDDWSPHPDAGDLVEPGHMMEWVWLMDRLSQHDGADRSALLRTLYARAVEIGRDPVSGFLVTKASAGGPFQPGPRRSWPQLEFLRASLVMARGGASSEYETAADLIDALLASYLSGPFPGGWIDQYDAAGAPVPGPVSASTLYHYVTAAVEVADALDRLGD